MSEYEDTRPVPGEPGSANDASVKDKTMPPAQASKRVVGDAARTADTAGQAKSAAQDVRAPLEQSPACERKR